MKNEKIYKSVLLSLLAFTVILNIVGIFVLPESIITSISFSGEGKHISTYLYLALSAGVVMLSSLSGYFTKHYKRYTVITAILTAANTVAIILNLINN